MFRTKYHYTNTSKIVIRQTYHTKSQGLLISHKDCRQWEKNQSAINKGGRCNFIGANRERVLIRHFPSTPICELLYDRRAEFIGYHYRGVIALSVAGAVNGLILSHHNLEQNGNNIHNR